MARLKNISIKNLQSRKKSVTGLEKPHHWVNMTRLTNITRKDFSSTQAIDLINSKKTKCMAPKFGLQEFNGNLPSATKWTKIRSKLMTGMLISMFFSFTSKSTYLPRLGGSRYLMQTLTFSLVRKWDVNGNENIRNRCLHVTQT